MFIARCAIVRRNLLCITMCSIGLLAVGRPAAAQDKDKTPAEPPVVPVAQVVEREVTNYADFTGHVEAAESVNVVSRVTGYLMSVAVKEGADVKKGDLLFEIDARPFEAELDKAEAELRIAEIKLKQAQLEFSRAKELLKRSAISQEEYEKIQIIVPEAEAALKVAKAAAEVYRLNLSFCKVITPIDGRVGRLNLTPGNLVKQDDTVLTTIVARDRIFIDFEIDERTFLRMARDAADAKGKRFAAGSDYPVLAALVDETGFPHKGTLSFVGNEFNRSTGTILARASFDNPTLKSGGRLFTPGMFVRVRIPVGEPHKALLVPNEAIHWDPFHFVVVVHDDDRIEWRKVQFGLMQDDGMRVIESGLKSNENVVASGIQIKSEKIQRKSAPTNGQK